MREALVIYVKGFAMGTADVVPGVSGATIALIVGIYDRLIRAITAIDPRALRPALRPHRADEREAVRDALTRMDVPFLVALGLGVVSAIVVLSNAMYVATTEYPVATYAFFFGLIAASAIVLYRDVDVRTPRRIAVAVCGIALAALVTGVTASGASHGPLIVFAAGAVAICAMVLPGVSGAFLLLVLGQYEYMTGVLSEFTGAIVALLNGDSIQSVVEPGTVVLVFGAGAAVGLFSMAHAVRYALDRYRAATMTFLVSLMVGALRLPVERVAENLGETGAASIEVAFVAGVAGAAVVLALDLSTEDLLDAGESP
ncbi:DUF368 domain-containing protein [Halovivax sp.]|uniref:DUF368 domain-containing protein n=1 Tax=Halovivax sp. TaxID=1935978 RepID=UPI0025BC660E|nr:DUF368 domain-containing protein [Halovivax sp.]